MDRLYPIVGRRKVPKPELCIRRMHTMWGSCSRDRGRITLNKSLLKAPQCCIDYVVLHELLHFLYPRHDKDFRTALSVHMPDWCDRHCRVSAFAVSESDGLADGSDMEALGVALIAQGFKESPDAWRSAKVAQRLADRAEVTGGKIGD